ncbi:hypothetical protein M9Y10_014505 [Tritrichomonas musculus]|uniref:F5/8 type C domain-containing protein n=1 Tax=Tritrichomonas musculus TaxID=1915356 RepID=A0ABR2L0W4_9EUKA
MIPNKIRLKTSSILNVPLNSYDEFIFIVNNQKFKTSRIISDLLSPKICKIHISDPAFNTFSINTINKGNFSSILNLVNFKENNIPDNDLPFITEVIEILGNTSIKIEDSTLSTTLTFDNVFQYLKKHEECPTFYSKRILTEIDFISSHLFELPSEKEIELTSLHQTTIERILRNPKIQIESEDQLISLINRLYKDDHSYSDLYELVYFTCVSEEKIEEFLKIFDYNNLTGEVWNSISLRFKTRVKEEQKKENRYRQSEKTKFLYERGHEFEGIIKYLKTKSKNDIRKYINITSTAESNKHHKLNIIDCDDKERFFSTGKFKDRWICFQFKENKVKLSHYTIRNYISGPDFPRSWVIEGSNEDSYSDKWEVIDERINAEEMKGKGTTYTFSIQNKNDKAFSFIRMRSTGADWDNDEYLCINAIEFFGSLSK